jgi:hypothetical protein
MNTDEHRLISEEIIGCTNSLGMLINFGTTKVQIKKMLNNN